MRSCALRELLLLLERHGQLPAVWLEGAYRSPDPVTVAWEQCDDPLALMWLVQLRGPIDTLTTERLLAAGMMPLAFVRWEWWERPVRYAPEGCRIARLVLPVPTLAELVAMPMRARVGRG
jgi:hypothetical protein